MIRAKLVATKVATIASTSVRTGSGKSTFVSGELGRYGGQHECDRHCGSQEVASMRGPLYLKKEKYQTLEELEADSKEKTY